MTRNKESRGAPRDISMTAEEKEALRQLMETPGIEQEWDFFEGMKTDVPPPEFFMRGKPEPRHKILRRVLAVCACIALFLGSSLYLATLMVPAEVTAGHSPLQIVIANIRNSFLTVRSGSNEDNVVVSLDTVIEDEALAMEKGKEVFPELLIPTYIPEGFSFEKLYFKENEDDDVIAVFRYIDSAGNVLSIRETQIKEARGTSFDNSIIDAEQEGEDILLFKQDDVYGENMLTIWRGEKFKYYITGLVETEELRNIYHGLE